MLGLIQFPLHFCPQYKWVTCSDMKYFSSIIIRVYIRQTFYRRRIWNQKQWQRLRCDVEKRRRRRRSRDMFRDWCGCAKTTRRLCRRRRSGRRVLLRCRESNVEWNRRWSLHGRRLLRNWFGESLWHARNSFFHCIPGSYHHLQSYMFLSFPWVFYILYIFTLLFLLSFLLYSIKTERRFLDTKL